MSGQGEPLGAGGGPAAVRFVAAVAVPLAVVIVAFVLWWVSDRLLYVGPLDRAAFGWAVVMPTWLAAPVAAGFAWRRLDPGFSLLAALILGIVVAGAAAGLLWPAVGFPDCPTGAIRTPGESVIPSLIVGVTVGGGLAVSSLIAAQLVRQGRPWRAVIAGAGAELVMVLLAILVAAASLLGPSCQRPSV